MRYVFNATNLGKQYLDVPQLLRKRYNMTTPLERIESHPHESKRLIGIEYEHFLMLVELAEERHLEKQAFIEKKKIR